jgi:glycine dehydrogenase subunit 2
MTEPTIYELSSPGRVGVRFPEVDVPLSDFPDTFLRKDLPLPELSELDVIRHFTHLSSLNYCIDKGFYPLGSCTMKYNPKINEEIARLPGFALTHPHQPVNTIQGNLALMYELQQILQEISGFAAVTLEPAAGAQGELTGVLIISAYHRSRNDEKRTKILIPDSAHGTNPATSAMGGFDVVHLNSDERGNVDLNHLRELCDETTAGLMLTNPNTLGLFDENVEEVVRVVHEAGGLVYGDGANLNALLGIVKPGDLGFDIMHFNLHKTFSTPHGGGGPGSGPVGVCNKLEKFLPTPLIGILEPASDALPPLYGFIRPEKTVGRVKSFFGQFGMLVRAYTYIRMHGPEGLKKISEYAVLNANYLLVLLKGTYKLPFERACMHEFVLEGKWAEVPEVHALDIAKRLMDYNFHPPQITFPSLYKRL